MIVFRAFRCFLCFNRWAYPLFKKIISASYRWPRILLPLLSRIASLFLVVIALSACVATGQQQVTIISQPAWVDKPELVGYIAVVGSAMRQNIGGIEAQRRAALLRARATLAKSVRVFVTKSLIIHKRQDQSEMRVDQSIDIRAFELQQLHSAEVKAEWISPQSSELFIWYVIPVKQ